MLLGDIGDAARRQPLDQRLHLVDVRGRARLVGRRQAAERRDVGVELAFGRLGDAGDRRIERQVGEVARGAGVDLVVDVGDVARVDDVRLRRRARRSSRNSTSKTMTGRALPIWAKS